MKKYTCVILDEDIKNANRIHKIITSITSLECIAIASKPKDAVELIASESPDIIFYNLAKSLENVNFNFNFLNELKATIAAHSAIMITANSGEYLQQALRNNVFDYFITPLVKKEIQHAVKRYEEQFTDKHKLKTSISNSNNTHQNTVICLKSYGDYKYMLSKEILYLKADNNSTDIYLSTGEKISAFKTLKHFEQLLPYPFVRIHNSYIINSEHIVRIHTGKNICYIKDINTKIPYSRSHRNNILSLLSQISRENYIEV